MGSLLRLAVAVTLGSVALFLYGCSNAESGDDYFTPADNLTDDFQDEFNLLDWLGLPSSWAELLRAIFWNSNVVCAPYRQGFPTSRDCAALVSLAKNTKGVVQGNFGGAPDYSILLDPDDVLTTWDGFGTSLSWWANAFGDRADIADALFTLEDGVTINGSSKQVPGLGFNVARYNLGASGDRSWGGATMHKSKNMYPKKAIQAYWQDGASRDTNSSSWDWTVDAKQRAALIMAKDRGADQFELFAKSPVWWQTNSKSPSGAANDFHFEMHGLPAGIANGIWQDNLNESHVDDHAYHLAQVAKHAKENWNITFASVEALNEPSMLAWHANGTQEGCFAHRQQQERIIRSLRAALDDAGLETMPIAASDESLVSFAIETWYQFSPETKALVDRVNYHNYEYLEAPRDEIYEYIGRSSGKKLWQTEHGEGNRNGLAMAMNLQLDLLKGRVSSWSYWQPFDANGWGLYAINDSWHSADKGVLVEPETKWWILAQFSRHIRPGMAILRTSDDDAPVVAAFDRNNSKLTFVVVAYHDDTSIQFPLAMFEPVTSWNDTKVTYWKTNTGDAQQCSTDADCHFDGCDQPDLVKCHDKQCFTGTRSENCTDKANGFDLQDGSWCFAGRRDMRCPLQEVQHQSLYVRSEGPAITDKQIQFTVPVHTVITVEVEGINVIHSRLQ